MLHPTYPLETERLLLRPFEEGDKEWLFQLRQIKNSMRYLAFGGESWEEIDETLARRTAMNGLDEVGDRVMLLLIHKETGKRVGEVALFSNVAHEQAGEVGFILHPDYEGKGYANEGAREMLRLGFEEAGFHRMIGICDARNAASKAVLLRLGMREEALFRKSARIKGEWRDQLVFAILKEEWRALQAV